jgi:adenosylhomocysteine nucleosidase
VISARQRPVIAVTGLAVEARIARGRGIVTVVAGTRVGLMQRLDSLSSNGIAGVISIGIAGALDPALAAGAWLIARTIVTMDARYATDQAWTDELSRRLPGATPVDIAGVDDVIVDVAAKRAAFAAYRAAAADMESHVVARFAATRGVPFAAFRVISDTARRTLPEAARHAMRTDGTLNMRAALGAYARFPRDLLALPRTAIDAGKAIAALRRGRKRLGAGLGFPDFDELVLDVL